MAAMTLPAMNPAPVPTPGLAPPSPAAFTAPGNAAGPGSFSQLLEAADARRQAEAPEPAPAPKPSAENKPTNSASRAPGPTQKAPTREGMKTDRATAQADADNPAAEHGMSEAEPDASVAEEATAPNDAASLLASLGLIQRPSPGLVPGEGGAARGRAGAGRQLLENAVDATQARSGTAVDAAAGPGAGGALAADLQATAATAERGAAGKAFAGLLAAAQGAETTTATAAIVIAEQRLAPQAEARPADASALGALLGAGAAPAAHTTGGSAAHPAEARLGTTPGHDGFAEQLGAQLSTFVREGVQHARLQLHPLELGPVTVQIQLDGGSAHLSFAAEHALTRQALEQALPTLASSLREAGLTLSGGGVFEQPRQPQPEGDNGRGDGSRASGGRGRDGGADDSALQATASPAPRRRGVVDLMA